MDQQQTRPIRVRVEGLGVVEFPAGTSEADMSAAIDSQLKGSTPPPSSGASGGYGTLASIGDFVKEAVKGGAKGAASTALGISQLINKGTAAVGLSDPVKPEVWNAARADFATPQGTAQKVGFGAEQLGEFFVPGAAVTKGAKALTTGSKVANVGVRAGLEGASAAGVHAAQTGNTEGAGTMGLAGAAFGAVAPALSGAMATRAGQALKESAEKRIAQALGAHKERFKAIAEKRAPEILKRGLGGSRSQLLKEAAEQSSEAGKAVDAVLKEHGATPLSTASIVDALETAKQPFLAQRPMTVTEAYRAGVLKNAKATGDGNVATTTVLDPRPVEQLQKLQDTVRALGDDATVDQIVAVRRVWDKVVEQAGGFAHRAGSDFGLPLAEKTEAWAKREATKAIRRTLEKEVPDLAAVNKEFAFWKDLKSVLTATEAREQAKNNVIPKIIASGVGVTSGVASGDTMEERIGNAALYGFLGPKVLAGLQSARWKFIDARLRNALAEALATQSPVGIRAAAARIAAVGAGKASANSDAPAERRER